MSDTNIFKGSQIDNEVDLADKLATITRLNDMLLNLFYTVSHNLNSYTANIKMIAELIDTEDEVSEQKVMMNHLRTMSNDLNKTLVDLSQVVYIQNNEVVVKQSLNLNEYLKKVTNIINGYNNNPKMIVINTIPDDVFVMHNPAYLESILLNFCTNAIKYAHPERFPVVEFGFSKVNGEKVLTIEDNGLGIDLERYGKSLFGLNKTFHQHENANGIGLYLTKYQIEVMKGTISVESKVGEGTTFKIHFSE